MGRYGQSILPVAYDGDSNFDTNIVSGETFTCTKKFMILSNKPIPKHNRVYMEFTITQCGTDKSTLRNLPFYVGVSREPSLGFLLSDFCLGSIYYCNSYYFSDTKDYTHPLDIQTIERYKSNADTTISAVTSKLGGKIPVQNTVIGIKTDPFKNTISIYSDGNLMYSFSPKAFKLSDSNDYFFCLVNPLDDFNIKGKTNFGRISMKYCPSDCWTMYQEYYDKTEAAKEITGHVYLGTVWNENQAVDHLVDSKIQLSTPYSVPTNRVRSPHLDYYSGSVAYTDNKTMKVVAGQTNVATVCYPCPTNQKVYFELTCKEATLLKNTETGLFDMVGIPLSIGISQSKTNYNNAFWFNLWHMKHTNYYTYANTNGSKGKYSFTPLVSTIPSQPQTVGFIFDLANNKIQIVTDGDVFAEVNIKGHDYSNEGGLYWIFIKTDPEVYEGTGYCIANFGEETLDFAYVPDNKYIMSFFYYWNCLIRDPVNYYIYGIIQTRSYKTDYNKIISSTIYVPNTGSDSWTPGMNLLWGTYNTVSNTEAKNNIKTISSDKIYDQIENEKETNVR